MALYVPDYNGDYPPWYVNYSSPSDWGSMLAGKTGGAAYLPVPKTTGKANSVLDCPANPTGWTGYTTYGANMNRFSFYWSDVTWVPGEKLTDRTLSGPSNLVMVYCCAGPYIFGGAPNGAWGDWNGSPRYRCLHNESYPVVWFDGHVSVGDPHLMSIDKVANW
ncbi:MAG: hypothetical protein WC708_19310 [Lentisphaeria bacterium]